MNFGIVLTARLQSSRLKNKALLELNNLPMIEQIIIRLKHSNISKKIVLSTSKNKKNNIFKKICKKYKILFFRGSQNDVMRRIYDTAKKYKLDNIICCTGDNPFVDFKTINLLKKIQTKNKFDFIKTCGLPWGSFSYLVKKDALKEAIKIKNTNNTEVWFDYFTLNKKFKIKVLKLKYKKKKYPNLRLTVDYKKDYILARLIYIFLQKGQKPFNLTDVIKFYLSYKRLFKINYYIKQKKYKKIKIKDIYKGLYQNKFL